MITYHHDPVDPVDQLHQVDLYYKTIHLIYYFFTRLTEDLVDLVYHHDQHHHGNQVKCDHLKIQTEYHIIIFNQINHESSFTYRFHQEHLSYQDGQIIQDFL
jgi:hypothetical protein